MKCDGDGRKQAASSKETPTDPALTPGRRRLYLSWSSLFRNERSPLAVKALRGVGLALHRVRCEVVAADDKHSELAVSDIACSSRYKSCTTPEPSRASCSARRYQQRTGPLNIIFAAITRAHARWPSIMLPPELVRLVVDYIDNDRASLVSCSLVSKSWVLAARFYLFHTLTVQLESSRDGLAAFLQFLASPWGESNAPYVRALYVKGNCPHTQPQLDPVVDLHTLGSILHRLYNLESLELQAVAWPGIAHDGPLLPTAPSVRSLTISQISMWVFSSLEEVLDIFHLLPNVKTVHTNEVSWRRHITLQEDKPRRPFPPELQVENLVLRTSGFTWRFLDLSQRVRSFYFLTSLSIWRLEVDEIPSLGRLLRNVAGRLRHLHLKLSDIRLVEEPVSPTPDQAWAHLNLHECKKLESFAVFVPLDDNEDFGRPALDYYPYWESVLVLLRSLPDSITTLHFGIENILSEEYFLEDVLDEVEWEYIDLLPERMPRLESVSFLWEDKHHEHETFQHTLPKWTRKKIKKYLPELSERGMLKFQGPNKRARRAGKA